VKTKKRSKRRVRTASEDQQRAALMIGAPLLLVLGMVGVGYATGGIDQLTDRLSIPDQPLDIAVASYQPSKAGFHDLPEILVNLDSGGRKPMLLKIRASLELADENDSAEIERALPRIVDQLHIFLREVRPSDMQGAQGLERIRREFLVRTSEILGPAVVTNVLFKEITAQ
jgi:flagellar FliL protein